jgi:hypothetical protein
MKALAAWRLFNPGADDNSIAARNFICGWLRCEAAMRGREPATSAVPGDAVEAARSELYIWLRRNRFHVSNFDIPHAAVETALAAADRARGRNYEPPLYLIEIARLRKLLQECVDFWPSAINDDLQQSTHKAAAAYLECTKPPRFTQALFDALVIPGMKPITPDQWLRMSGPDAIPGEGWTYGYDGCISSRYTPGDDPLAGDLGSTKAHVQQQLPVDWSRCGVQDGCDQRANCLRDGECHYTKTSLTGNEPRNPDPMFAQPHADLGSTADTARVTGTNWTLSPRDSAAFIAALENPPEPNDALRVAAAKYKSPERFDIMHALAPHDLTREERDLWTTNHLRDLDAVDAGHISAHSALDVMLGNVVDAGAKAPEWTAPWNYPELKDWSIVGMNHYHINKVRFLFVAMTKDGNCIKVEEIDDRFAWEALKRKAAAFAPAPEPAWPPGDCKYQLACKHYGHCTRIDCPHAGRPETEG